MQAAERELQELNIYDPDPKIYASALQKVRRASLDCYTREVSSAQLQSVLHGLTSALTTTVTTATAVPAFDGSHSGLLAAHVKLSQTLNSYMLLTIWVVLVQIAANDTIETRATIFTQGYVKIADPCTFRLIAKNVTNLLPKDQQDLKKKTYKQLEELIRFGL